MPAQISGRVGSMIGAPAWPGLSRPSRQELQGLANLSGMRVNPRRIKRLARA
jgi:hypothetical protein